MIDYQKEVLIALPHLDDEFALVPIIKKITSNSKNKISIIYCAERNISNDMNNKRRKENLRALESIGCRVENITYINDFFKVDDLKLLDAASDIHNFLTTFINKHNIKQIVTLNFEGGHPDHDSLALIVKKISDSNKQLNCFFVPAYNSRRSLLFPVSVFRPLKSQQLHFYKEKHNLFVWIDAFFIALEYQSERSAFMKLMPFIIFNIFFSKSIYISSQIDIESVNWDNSLSLKRYSAIKQNILNKIEVI
tara:strand:- start:7075 stop:7824 length:750 start_codon:yes stop_codon:yes gene_type:complete